MYWLLSELFGIVKYGFRVCQPSGGSDWYQVIRACILWAILILLDSNRCSRGGKKKTFKVSRLCVRTALFTAPTVGSPDLGFSPSHKLFCWVGVGGQSHWCYIMVWFTSSPSLPAEGGSWMEFKVMSFPVPILYPFCVEADFRYESVRISVDENPCSVH